MSENPFARQLSTLIAGETPSLPAAPLVYPLFPILFTLGYSPKQAVPENTIPKETPMRTLKHHVLLAHALLVACSTGSPVQGSDDNEQRAAAQSTASQWRGLEIRPENRCSPYNRSDYPYSQSVERVIIERLGRIYSPYTGHCFASQRETDIEHIVALSEAHDSGLCEPVPNVMQLRRSLASDPLNLTLASPQVNRSQKKHYDGAEWMPPMNKCWFAQRIVEVRRKYGLTIDRREAQALERILSSCSSVEMESIDCATPPSDSAASDADSRPLASSSALNAYDDDGNGRITCAEARRHGLAPVSRSHPAYPFMRDGDGDGVVCE